MTVDWQLVTAWATIVIAVIAVIASFRQGAHARAHNKLSVRPYFSFQEQLVEPQELTMKNNGTGPGIIKHFEVWVDDDVFDSQTHDNGVKVLTTLGLTAPDMAYGWLSAGDVVAVGDSQRIIFRDPTGPSPTSQQSFVNAVKRVSVKIKYESIYGDTYETKFGRKFGRSAHR